MLLRRSSMDFGAQGGGRVPLSPLQQRVQPCPTERRKGSQRKRKVSQFFGHQPGCMGSDSEDCLPMEDDEHIRGEHSAGCRSFDPALCAGLRKSMSSNFGVFLLGMAKLSWASWRGLCCRNQGAGRQGGRKGGGGSI